MCDIPSHGSDHLWLIWKESIQNCRCYSVTERTRQAGQTDGRTDRRMEWNQYTPQQLRCSGGITMKWLQTHKFFPIFLLLHIIPSIMREVIYCVSAIFNPGWCEVSEIPCCRRVCHTDLEAILPRGFHWKIKIDTYHNLVLVKLITTNFCTCHDSNAVMACAKVCSNYFEILIFFFFANCNN